MITLFFAALLAAAPTTGAPALEASTEAAVLVPELAKKADTSFLVRRYDRALGLYEQVTASNPTVGLYWFRLGQCCLEEKQFEKAIRAFEKSEALGAFQWNPLRIVYRGESAWGLAAAHAALGNRAEAFAWTRKSLAQGLRDVRRFHSAQFMTLLSDADYRKLVWAEDVKSLPREAGMRHDLRFLLHEAKRIHFAPFRQTPESELDALAKSIDAEMTGLSDEQILVRWMSLVRRLGDGHTQIRPTGRPEVLPLELYRFDDGLYVVAAQPPYKELVGSKVLRIGQRSGPEALAAVDEIASRDNPMTVQLFGPMLLRSLRVMRGLDIVAGQGPVALEVRNAAGRVSQVEVAAVDKIDRDQSSAQVPGCEQPLPLYLSRREATYWFAPLADKQLVYCQLNGIGTDSGQTMGDFCKRLFAAVEQPEIDTLVIDMRFNGGGNTFTNPPLIEGIQSATKINRAGRLYVIIGRKTFSAAQNTVSELERRTKAILVGEPTGSCPNFIGESLNIPLPYCGWELSLSDLWWQHSMAMDYRTWTPPHVYAPPTIEAFRAHRDPCLEAIMALRAKQGST